MKITLEFDSKKRTVRLTPEGDALETALLEDMCERSKKGTSITMYLGDRYYEFNMDINGQKRNYDALEEKL